MRVWLYGGEGLVCLCMVVKDKYMYIDHLSIVLILNFKTNLSSPQIETDMLSLMNTKHFMNMGAFGANTFNLNGGTQIKKLSLFHYNFH